MEVRVTAIIVIVVMIALIVGVDVSFLRHHFLARLIANVGIVLVFAALYVTLLRRR